MLSGVEHALPCRDPWDAARWPLARAYIALLSSEGVWETAGSR